MFGSAALALAVGVPLAAYFFMGAPGMTFPEPPKDTRSLVSSDGADPAPGSKASLIDDSSPQSANTSGSVGCDKPTIVDGDTLRCGEIRIRLASIDAPELPGHCRIGRTCVSGDPYASTESLRRLIGDQPIKCRQTDTDRYGRVVAFCSAGGRDLSCAQVAGGFAIVRYGSLTCAGVTTAPAE